jgi:hypothetical protein
MTETSDVLPPKNPPEPVAEHEPDITKGALALMTTGLRLSLRQR